MDVFYIPHSLALYHNAWCEEDQAAVFIVLCCYKGKLYGFEKPHTHAHHKIVFLLAL